MIELYKQFRLKSYQELFGKIREKDGSLSATEAFAVDVIYLLGIPTISQFADSLGVSQPNATYKANNLQGKGYIDKAVSEDDKRECRLSVSDKFFEYFDTGCRFLTKAVETVESSFTKEEIMNFLKILRKFRTEIQ